MGHLSRSIKRLGVVSLITVLSACESAPKVQEEVDAGRTRTPRDAGSGGMCIACTMVASFVTGEFSIGGPAGPGGGVPGACEADADAGAPMGGMQFTFCAEAITNAMLGCLRAKCMATCGTGMPMGAPVCTADGGFAAFDAGMPSIDAGGRTPCAQCLETSCAGELTQCKAN